MGNALLWTAVGGLVNGVLLPFFIQILKKILPPKAVVWLKGTGGQWVVWVIACIAAVIQLALQNELKPIVWSDPSTATAAVLALGTAVANVAQTIYRTWEPTFKKFLEMLGGEK